MVLSGPDGSAYALISTAGTSLDLYGAGDVAYVVGSGNFGNALGANQTVEVDGAYSTANAFGSATGTSLHLYGTGDVAYVAGSGNFGNALGANQTVEVDGAYSTANAFGSATGTSLNLYGTGDTAQIGNGQVDLGSGGTSVVVEGSGDTVLGAFPGDVVGFTGVNDTAAFSGGQVFANGTSAGSLIVTGSGDSVSDIAGTTQGAPVLGAGAAEDIEAIYDMVLGRDPTPSDLASAQVTLASGGTMAGLMAALANSAEAQADMAATCAAEGAAAPSGAEFAGFADAMSASYGAPIEVFSVDPVTGAQTVLADTYATNLLAELPALETQASGVNLGLQLADGSQVQFASTARLADFLYAVAVQQGQGTSFVTADCNLDAQWLDTVDQPLLNEAVGWSEQAAGALAAGEAVVAQAGSGAAGWANAIMAPYQQQAAELDELASMALKIAGEAPSSRQDMTVTIPNPVNASTTQLTVYANGSGGRIHDIDPGVSVASVLESLASIVVNTLAAVFPETGLPYLAAAIDGAQAGQDFANGQVVPGLLSLAQAVASGIDGVEGAVTDTSKVITVAAQGVGGVYGVVQSAESGNAAGILAGALEAAAAVASGIAMDSSGQTQQELNQVAAALGTTGAFGTVASDFGNGNLGQGLVDSLGIYLSAVAQAYQNSQTATAQVEQPPAIFAEDVATAQTKIAPAIQAVQNYLQQAAATPTSAGTPPTAGTGDSGYIEVSGASVATAYPPITQQALGLARRPDIISISVGSSLTYSGTSETFEFSRYGDVFVSAFGMSAGVNTPSWFSGSITANWIFQAAVPSQSSLANFFSGSSNNVTGGALLGLGVTQSGSSFAVGAGLMTPQAGFNTSTSYLIGNFGPRW